AEHVAQSARDCARFLAQPDVGEHESEGIAAERRDALRVLALADQGHAIGLAQRTGEELRHFAHEQVGDTAPERVGDARYGIEREEYNGEAALPEPRIGQRLLQVLEE